MQALLGLWYILAGATVASIIGGAIEWAAKRRTKHPDAAAISHRIDNITHWFTCGRFGSHATTTDNKPGKVADNAENACMAPGGLGPPWVPYGSGARTI